MEQNKQSSVKKDKVKRGLQAFGIWFKDTAWVQVVLVVILVFAIVFSIPFIVNAITATETDDEKTLDFLEDRRVTYSELNKKISNTSREFTVVYYYNGSSSSDTTANLIRKNIFDASTKYYDNSLFGKYFVTLDVNRLDENDEDDYDLTADQLEEIGTTYNTFYNANIMGHDFTYTDSSTGKITKHLVPEADIEKPYSSLGGFPSDKYTVPTGTIAVYKNAVNSDVVSTEPIWLDLGIASTSNDTDFMDELIASVNYNIADPTNPNKILVIK